MSKIARFRAPFRGGIRAYGAEIRDSCPETARSVIRQGIPVTKTAVCFFKGETESGTEDSAKQKMIHEQNSGLHALHDGNAYDILNVTEMKPFSVWKGAHE